MKVQLSQAAADVTVSVFLVGSGLVSGGGGTDAVQERHAPTERSLWDSEQHDGGQQLRPGQREVWYALNNHPHIHRGGHPARSRYIHCVCVCWPLSSPDGSYTEEQNSETQVKAVVNPTSTTPDFDDEFDDEESLPTIGTCKALYPFEGLLFFNVSPPHTSWSFFF